MTTRATRAWLAAGLCLVLGACAPLSPPRTTGGTGAAAVASTPRYYPPAGRWEHHDPAAEGMDPARLAEAVEFARTHETSWPTDLRVALERSGLASGPYGEIVGPVKDRGGPAGVVVRHGFIVAEWGDVERVDMTFSVTKSFLSTLAGVAYDEGLIRSFDDPIRQYVPGEAFASAHDAPITWDMLLRQVSEWTGTLWGKPDVADRREGRDREIHEPGTFWEYNDVRVNLAAFALLNVWKRPLPEVLEDRVMDPIGASDSWRWHGYRTSYTPIGGRSVQSVSGGGHWGGGMWINTLDMARFGLLYERGGEWEDERLLSEGWIRRATTPTGIKPTYGYMWWLNTDRKLYPSAPAGSFFALGAGSNFIWIDPADDLVVVVRWIENRDVDGFLQRVRSSLTATSE